MRLHEHTYTGPYLKRSNHHLYIAPAKALSQIVAHYTITFPNAEVEIPENSVLHLIPDVSGCFVFHFYDEMTITVWGPTTEIVIVNNDLQDAPCRFFVEFLPAGLYQILGIPLQQLLNQKIDLSKLNPVLFHEIQECMSKMDSFDELVKLMNTILINEMEKHKIEAELLASIMKITSETENVNGTMMAKTLGMSERQLTRYFNRYVGMGIKKYAKITKVNHVIQNLAHQNMIDLTYGYAYFDQAHFNHVFKEVCAISPTEYLKNITVFYNEFYKF